MNQIFFLTFTGLTRLVHHILKNFIFSCEETGFEEIDFVEEIPHLANFPLAPQYWITDERGVDQKIFLFIIIIFNIINPIL